MTGSGLRAETEATLLLCGRFGASRQEEAASPLEAGEFNELLSVLDHLSLTLPDLLHPGAFQALRHTPETSVLLSERLETLLKRGAALAIALERWERQGYWVLDRTDPAYPERFHRLLGASANPLLYGAGNRDLLNQDQRRVAVTGSRDIDAAGASFARDLGAAIAAVDAITVSGGARGADRTAIDGALKQGGTGIAILPGALEQVATSRAYRQAIGDGQLTVISPYHPGAKFTAGNAMSRNRLIYCLADVGVVVESAEGSGGTWSGAITTLRKGWAPLAVRQTERPSAGNQALLERGAAPISPETLENPERFETWLTHILQRTDESTDASENRQLGLFND